MIKLLTQLEVLYDKEQAKRTYHKIHKIHFDRDKSEVDNALILYYGADYKAFMVEEYPELKKFYKCLNEKSIEKYFIPENFDSDFYFCDDTDTDFTIVFDHTQ